MLTAEKISYAVKNKTILREIGFEVRPGELLAVIGPNGAGKSTLLKILSGELSHYAGKVSFQNQDLKKIKPREQALKRAVLSQSISLTLPFKVSEVVMMGRYPHFDSAPSLKDEQIVSECLDRVGMKAFSERNFLTLSGGEKQRIHLARVLAQLHTESDEPRLLFLDEPVNGLDLKYQQQVMKIAREWMGPHNSVIAVLHDLNLAAHYADRVLLLDKGKQEILDTPEKVLTKENIHKVYDIEVQIIRQEENDAFYISPVFQNSSVKENVMNSIV